MTTVIERPEAASGPLVAPGGVVGPMVAVRIPNNPMHTDVCASCMDVGTLLCSVHGTPGYRHG